MIVVDTNVIASMWVPNDMDQWVYKVLKKDNDWVAPLLWRSEFRNILSEAFAKPYHVPDTSGFQHLLQWCIRSCWPYVMPTDPVPRNREG